tara:strand:- start:3520 stop:4911 length:1392 start_codon:yes stop_codon:yes gene_type:complete
MADDKASSASLLMNLPLEVRHTIFEYAAARDVKPKKLLRKWFEKKEVSELIAQHMAADPSALAPRVVQNNEYEEDSDMPEPDEAEDPDSEDNEEDVHDGEDSEHNDEEEDVDEAEQHHDQDQTEEGDEVGDEAEEEEEGAIEQGHVSLAQPTPQPPTSVSVQSPAQAQAALPTQTQNNGVDGSSYDADMDGEHEDQAEGEADTEEAQQGELATNFTQIDASENGDETMVGNDGDDGEDGHHEADDDGDADRAATAPPPPPRAPAPVIRAARKWRYIPNFMRITHCPPPVELLLASKQLNDEAKNWFYDVAILRINATGSFAHTSFFEEAFSQITEAAFSPMENVRKVEVTFVWDTTWLRADTTGCAEAIFPALLRQRSDFVRQILSQAPDLREVTIQWHDSAQDDESANFMLDILAPFLGLKANVKVEEHYIAVDAKPHKRSIAGKRRLEFQAIVDAGLDRLF